MPLNSVSSPRDSLQARRDEGLPGEDVADGSDRIPFPHVEEPSTPVTRTYQTFNRRIDYLRVVEATKSPVGV